MRLALVYLIVSGVLVMAAAFVWGWLIEGRTIPGALFTALLGLLGTVVGYAFHRREDDGPPAPPRAPRPSLAALLEKLRGGR